MATPDFQLTEEQRNSIERLRAARKAFTDMRARIDEGDEIDYEIYWPMYTEYSEAQARLCAVFERDSNETE